MTTTMQNPDPHPPLDYRVAFELAPVGLALSRHRVIVDCNHELAQMFQTERQNIIGESFEMLYPSAEEYERTGARIAPILNAVGKYADERIMKRAGGELFWCHVTGRALDRDDPHAAGIWSFEDLSPKRRMAVALTGREREVAALLIEGRTSKEIGRTLGISPRTVDIYRGRLLRKYLAATTAELVQQLLSA
jgi:PAS domain S-box-containing protein